MLLSVVRRTLLLAFLQAAAPTQPPANTPASAQAATQSLADTPTPTDPNELLDLARKVNGLTRPDVQPWHLKATFEVFDDNGKSKDKGTFEEWWVSDKQFKRSYMSAGFSETQYGTEHGTFFAENDKWPTGPYSAIRSRLVHPLPSDVSSSAQSVADRELGTTKLRCLYIAPKSVSPAVKNFVPAAYCFSPEKPILRLFVSGNKSEEATFNRILFFRGAYLGGDIEVTRLEKPYVSIHVESLAPLDEASRIDFEPPKTAVLAPTPRIALNAEAAVGRLIYKAPPEYPPDARAHRIQGTVTIQAVIGTDGHIKSDLRVLSGPPELQQAAVDAVRKWEYTPFLVDGKPAEVETIVNVVFSLGE